MDQNFQLTFKSLLSRIEFMCTCCYTPTAAAAATTVGFALSPTAQTCLSFLLPPVVTIWFSAFLHCSRHLPAYYKPIFTCWIPPPPPPPPYYPLYSVRCRVFSSSRGKWIEFYIGHGQRFVTNSVRCTFLLLHCPHHPPRGTVNCITRMVHCNCTHNSVIILIKTRFILLINETISIEKGAVACDCMTITRNQIFLVFQSTPDQHLKLLVSITFVCLARGCSCW